MAIKTEQRQVYITDDNTVYNRLSDARDHELKAVLEKLCTEHGRYDMSEDDVAKMLFENRRAFYNAFRDYEPTP